MKILIVDDEELIRDGIEKRIIKYGYQPSKIYKAMDAHSAMQILEKEWIDLVFVDINMPFMNGLDFIEKVRKPEMYFVIISGYDKFEYAKKAIELGVVRYLLKPIDRQEFMALMDQMVELLDVKVKHQEYSSNVTMIMDCIHQNYKDMNFSLMDCAQRLQLSESTISKWLKKEGLMNFNDLVNQERIQYAKLLICQSEGKLKIGELASQCGFSSQQYFSVVFKKYSGVTPSQFYVQEKQKS